MESKKVNLPKKQGQLLSDLQRIKMKVNNTDYIMSFLDRFLDW